MQNHLAFLRLMQLADSALPIGTTAHSFGLETLVAEGILTVAQLEPFLKDYLAETGEVECVFCRLGYRLAACTDQHLFTTRWLSLNEHISAIKTARESRTASATFGRRLLQLVHTLTREPLLHHAIQSAKVATIDTHYSAAFGLAGAIIEADEATTTLAYVQQSLTGLISACQRLLPLGQSQAASLIWQLKPALLTIAARSEEIATYQDEMSIARRSRHPNGVPGEKIAAHQDEMSISTPLVEIGSMRHPFLTTRLFIS